VTAKAAKKTVRGVMAWQGEADEKKGIIGRGTAKWS
jgi:hypothetical protein